MEEKDCDNILKAIDDDNEKSDISLYFTLDEIKHYLLPKENIV